MEQACKISRPDVCGRGRRAGDLSAARRSWYRWMRIAYLLSIAPHRRFAVKDLNPLGAKLDIGGLCVAVGTMSLTPGPNAGRYAESSSWIAIAYDLTRFPRVVRPF